MSRFPTRPRPRPVPRPTISPTPTPSPTPGPGTTFTLTTNIETVPATGVLPANSTVTGVINGGTGDTFQTGDIINANATSDVKVTVAAVNGTPAVVAINNAGSVQFRNVTNAQTVNAVLYSGVRNVGSFGSLANGDITIINGDISSNYVLSNPAAQSAGVVADLTVGYINATGTNDVAKFAVENVGFFSTTAGLTNAALTVTGNTAEAATIATAGTNFFRPTIGSAATSLAITGSGNNSVTLSSGDLTNNAKTVSFATATGANALELGSFVRAGDTYTGGSGIDVLGITPAGLGATALNVSGFETLALQSGGVAGILGFATTPNFQQVRVLQSASDATITLSNAGAIPALNFVGTGTAAAQNFNSISAATSSSTVNVAFSNGTAVATGYQLGATGSVTLNGASTINLSIAGTSATQSSLDGDVFASTNLVSFNASGSGILGGTTALGINASGGTSQNLQTINLSGVTGTNQSKITTQTNSFAALTFTAAPGGSAYTPFGESSGDVVTFNGGAGSDAIDANTGTYLGLINFTGGASADTVTGNNATGGIIFAQGGAGNDTLTGGSAADTLQGDADNDIISGRVGLDVVSGGTGVDSFRYQESATTDIDTITDFAFGSTGDNIGYTAGTGFTNPSNATAVALVNGTAGDIGTGSAVTFASFGGGASQQFGTASSFVVLTSTSATSFASAIGTNGFSFGPGNGTTSVFAATQALGAVYFDSTNQQAVFGLLLDTDTAADNIFNNNDTFVVIGRAPATAAAYSTITTDNVTFF